MLLKCLQLVFLCTVSNAQAPSIEAPRVVKILVDGRQVHAETCAFAHPVPHLDGLGALGGSGLALALLFGSGDPHSRLALAVGNATARGLPSSGRVSLAGVSPLTGILAEATLGGEGGQCLATLCDGLLLEGPTAEDSVPRLLLVEERDGVACASLIALEIGGGTLRETCRAASARAEADVPGSTVALLEVGEAGLQRSPLAMISTGVNPMSSAGRGGLGALIGRLGLAGVAIRASLGTRVPPEVNLARLPSGKSPGLQARSHSGTLELFQAFAARGELFGRNYSEFLAPQVGSRLSAEAESLQRGRHGCRGCTTPCGLVFERKGGGLGGARFSASWALGPNLGLESFEDSLELLSVCDELGLDAREAGACLALLSIANDRGYLTPARFGDLSGLRDALLCLPLQGSEQLAKELGLEREHFAAQGAAARPEGNLASTLGQCVATGGNDPMRVFPFLVSPGAEASESLTLPDGTVLPEGAFDPRNPAGKGRVVAWHENFAAALDITGFCSFSSAGLIADEVCSIDELAEWIAPPKISETGAGRPWAEMASPGERFLAAGCALVLARRLENERLLQSGMERVTPEWAQAELSLPGMLDEYEVVRGLDTEGRVAEPQLAWLAGARGRGVEYVQPDRKQSHPPESEPSQASSNAEGVVTIAAAGVLASLLGGPEVSLMIQGPTTVAEALLACADEHDDARSLLFTGQRILPTAWRRGIALGAQDQIFPGDRLDLVVVLAGG